MKVLMTTALLLLSANTFSATIQDCHINETTKRVVVLNDAGNASIQKILSSKETIEMKTDLIKRVLYIETLSIGNGNSVCELAVKEYKVAEEKCLRVMKSSDLMTAIFDNTDDSEETSLDCKIGVTAKLLMQFNM